MCIRDRHIVLEKLFTDKDIERLENKIVSYKGLLLEWSQKTVSYTHLDVYKRQPLNFFKKK